MIQLRKAASVLALLFVLASPPAFAQEAPLFALTWSESDGTRFTHQTPMVWIGQSSWVKELKRIPEGRRAVVITWPHNSMWLNAEDRCRDAQGSLAHLSTSPRESTGMYRGGTGSDRNPSGFSCPWLDNWIEEARRTTQAQVDQLLAAGGSVDYLIFDVESKMDWLKIKNEWEAALAADPRWPAAQVVLDSLKQVGTGDPSARFSLRGDTRDGLAWNAYMWAQQARALNEGIFKVYQAAFPHVKGSNYEHHGRRPGDTTVETYGWDFYQTAITGTHASDYHYGWIIQAKDVSLGIRTLGENADWLTFVFEQRKARASVRAGYPIQPWIAYSGNENVDWRTSPKAPTTHTPNPYWQENIRHLLLLEADPLLYWNSRSYKDDDHSTDVLDGYVESLLEEVNSRIGTASPRYTITTGQVNWFSGSVNDQGKAARLPDGSGLIATGLRHGNNATYRVTVERLNSDPATWKAVSARVLRNGQDTGERVTIPAGSTGAYLTTTYREGEEVTFDFVPEVVNNLLFSLDVTAGLWAHADTRSSPPADAKVSCPVPGVPVGKLYDKAPFSVVGPPVTLERGKTYTFSAYLHGITDNSSGGVLLMGMDGSKLADFSGYVRERDGWSRYNVTYTAAQTANVVPVVNAYRIYACAPALHEGIMPGRVDTSAVTDPVTIEQRIQLHPGWNFVAFSVDPGLVSPDSILGQHEAVALVKNPAGEVYSTRFDIREIAVWDARQAYRVLADEPVEIVLTGRPLLLDGVDLNEGWNFVPYANAQPVDIATIAAAHPGVLLRVEDDAGNLYEPQGENITLHSFEPGKAYRIYAASAARIAFPN